MRLQEGVRGRPGDGGGGEEGRREEGEIMCPQLKAKREAATTTDTTLDSSAASSGQASERTKGQTVSPTPRL